MGRYWLVPGDTGSVLGGAGWYLVARGQFGAVLVGIWWYWVSMGRHWLALGSVLVGGTDDWLVLRGKGSV